MEPHCHRRIPTFSIWGMHNCCHTYHTSSVFGLHQPSSHLSWGVLCAVVCTGMEQSLCFRRTGTVTELECVSARGGFMPQHTQPCIPGLQPGLNQPLVKYPNKGLDPKFTEVSAKIIIAFHGLWMGSLASIHSLCVLFSASSAVLFAALGGKKGGF